ncbi:MAG: dephospho-CoA kinase [Acidobacteriota bacterium]|nr:dephospho-CoA kinase [Acidobacteriota bacterium]
MLIVGLTGGLACGKSFIASELGRLGCHVVEADELGHRVLEPGGEAHEAAIREFGTADRARLAEKVFGDPARLAKLNAIVHPAVHARAQRTFAEIRARDQHAIVVYVAAILVETGAWRDFDKLIVADCSRPTQIERAIERTGATEDDVRARLDRQLPSAKKREHADYIIETDGTKEETLRQTKMVYEELRKLA